MSTKADSLLVLPRDVLRAQLLLAEARLEVLLYPELGTDDFTMILAHGRYAPVQCVLEGHPLTTGLPSIDYAVVGEVLEGPGAQAQYREELVRLPGFLAHVPRPMSAEADRAKLNLPNRATLYLCGQRLSKIHPDMDALFARILKEDPKGYLCLFRDAEPALTERLMERLKGAGLPEDRVLWLKRARHGIYLAALGAADVVLDTLHWGGGVTAFEALGMGKPLVTLQGNTLRSRRAAGLCRMIGVSDGVARTEDGYVRIATTLGRDATKRALLSTRIRAAAAVLFEDATSVEALASFLVTVKPKPQPQPKG
jgi:predicted O-linked N-acetylglucosamine transferase (SPINDLY family)